MASIGASVLRVLDNNGATESYRVDGHYGGVIAGNAVESAKQLPIQITVTAGSHVTLVLLSDTANRNVYLLQAPGSVDGKYTILYDNPTNAEAQSPPYYPLQSGRVNIYFDPAFTGDVIFQFPVAATTIYKNTGITISVRPAAAPNGIAINAVTNSTTTKTAQQDSGATGTLAYYLNTPVAVTVQTGIPSVFSAVSIPTGFTSPNWSYIGAPILENIPLDTTSQTLTLIFAVPGTATVSLTAVSSDGQTRTSYNVAVTAVWGPVDSAFMKYVKSRAEGWESLPTYVGHNTPPIALDPTIYFGWSAPIAAADQLDYFRRKRSNNVDQYFPDYIGRYNQYDFMSDTWNATDSNPSVTESYSYPAWRRFMLDSARPASNATVANSDMTDFGWWMNTSNIGSDSALGTGDTPYGGSTVLGIFQGLDNFYTHAGHSNVVSGIFKNSNKVLGTTPPEYVSGAENDINAYKQMVQNLINNDKPFLISVNGNMTPGSIVPDVSTSWTDNGTFGTNPRWRLIYINWVAPGITFTINVGNNVLVQYTVTNSDTLASARANLVSKFNAIPLSTWNVFYSSHTGMAGYPPYAWIDDGTGTTFTPGTLIVSTDTLTFTTFSAAWSGTPSGGTPIDTIPSSGLNPNVGPEYVNNIYAMTLSFADTHFSYLNDPYPSGNYKTLTPTDGLGANPDKATGNVYLAIGYCLPTQNSNLPTDARGKFLIMCKDTSSSNDRNVYFALDQPLVGSDPQDNSLWSRLLATYTLNVSNTTYVAPRPPVVVDPAGSQTACINIPITVTPPMLSGNGVDNRFTHIYNGIGVNLTVNGNPVTNPMTFNSVGNYTVAYKLTDAVTHTSGQYSLIVNAIQNPQFAVTDSFGNSITGTPLHIATNNTYTYTPVAPINSSFTYTWTITRSDAPPASNDYVFVSGGPNTAGPIKVQFNNAGQYNVSLTTSGSTLDSCPGQYTLIALVTNVNLDFTYSNPTFMALPVTFNGVCDVAVSNWAWTFGDGGSVSGPSQQNPVHTYFSIGSMTVVLTVMTLYGTLSVTHNVPIYPAQAVADFLYKPSTGNVVGGTITFQDLSTPQPVAGSILADWAWTFGDGDTATTQNPSHAYSAPGVFEVTLVYTIHFGPGFSLSKTSSVTKQITVVSGAPIVKSQTFIVSRNLIDTYTLSDYTTSNNPITYSLTKAPKNGDAEFISGNTIQYQPNINYVGQDVLTFRATDNLGLYTEGNINLIVREPVLTVIVGEVLNTSHIITIRVGTAEKGELLLKQVVVQNTGKSDLLISNMSITEDNFFVFGLFDITQTPVTNFANLLLSPREAFTFYVGIKSNNTGTFKAKLQIDHN